MRALIIHNPAAGHRSIADELRGVVAALNKRDWEVIGVEETRGPGDATTYARKAVAVRCDALFVAGGDGTMAQALDGLVGSETALAVLPTGTGNVLARQLNLPIPGGLHPHPLIESAILAVDGQMRTVDAGRISARSGKGTAHHFLCWGGIGFDARLNQAVNADAGRKKRLGLGAFVVAGVQTLREFAGTSAVVRIDGHRVSRRILMMVANNIQLYGVVFRMAPRAVFDDGLLDVYIFQGRNTARTLLHALRVLTHRHVQDPHVDIYRARRIEVLTARTLPVHVDGDYIGDTPVTIEVVPHALKLLVPRCAPANLFVDGTGMTPPETTWEWMIRQARDARVAILERNSHP